MQENRVEFDVKPMGAASGFFLALAFFVAALGASAWWAFGTGVVEWHHHQTLAERMDNRTGVAAPLVSPVKFVIQRTSCIQIDRAYLDGSESLTLYVSNHCGGDGDYGSGSGYYEWGYREESPDGTIIKSECSNTLTRLPRGGKIEKHFDLTDDDRVTTVEVYADLNPC